MEVKDICFLLLILPGNFDVGPSDRERSCYQPQWYHDPTREFTVYYFTL